MDDKVNLVDQLMNMVFNQYLEAVRMSHYYDTDVEIFTSEIHLLVAIHENPNCNASQLAKLLGVPKSVISKIATKLEAKGLIGKFRLLKNDKEIFYALTTKGRVAYQGHINFHTRFFHNSWTNFSQMSHKEQQLIIDFLQNYSDYMAVVSESRQAEKQQRSQELHL